MLNPPRQFAHALIPARLRKRFERMIGLLKGVSDITGNRKAAAADVAAMEQCEFTLSPVPMPNLFIIGETIAFEGLKRGGTGGFDMTHWETDRKALNHLVKQFDDLFRNSVQDAIHGNTHSCLADTLQGYLDEAVKIEKKRQ